MTQYYFHILVLGEYIDVKYFISSHKDLIKYIDETETYINEDEETIKCFKDAHKIIKGGKNIYDKLDVTNYGTFLISSLITKPISGIHKNMTNALFYVLENPIECFVDKSMVAYNSMMKSMNDKKDKIIERLQKKQNVTTLGF